LLTDREKKKKITFAVSIGMVISAQLIANPAASQRLKAKETFPPVVPGAGPSFKALFADTIILPLFLPTQYFFFLTKIQNTENLDEKKKTDLFLYSYFCSASK
jgi:hypothetical protein